MDETMVRVALIAGAGLAWFGQAAGLSRLMARRGFHPRPWFVVPLFLGPALWPLAVFDWLSGPPHSRLVRRGRTRDGTLDVFVGLERDDVSEPTFSQLARLLPHARRTVIARVMRAEGPTVLESEAERFLHRAAGSLHAVDAELEIVYGSMDQAVARIQERGGFSVVLRSDRPDELFDGNGSRHEMRSAGHVAAA